MKWLRVSFRSEMWLEAAMATGIGLGLFITAFQGLAIVGVLGTRSVLACVLTGLLLTGVQARDWLAEIRSQALGSPTTWGEKCALALVALVALPTLVTPLAPPIAWDELMYHLPYARQVAQDGHAGIYEWLRYPWFPYNYDLLYAAALTVYDDVFTHLLHALAGWLSVWMIYRLGTQYANRYVACLAAAIWLKQGDYGTAYIDMGVTLFILSAFIALWWWREADAKEGASWLVLAAFLLGIAAGSKYQALIFLPLASVVVLRRERRLRIWALMLACFALPCIYWYVRNAIQTGDPFNPLGGRIFGFTNWNLADYRAQIADVHANAQLPSSWFWAVLIVPFSPMWRNSAAVRAAVVFCGYALFVWALTSRYPRYLITAYPLLALVAAIGWYQLIVWAVTAVRSKLPRPVFVSDLSVLRGRQAIVALIMFLSVVSILSSVRKSALVSATPGSREAVLRERVPGYEVMTWLRENPSGPLYQVGLDNAIYFAPDRVWGDGFGPWRHGDFLTLPVIDMARKLRAQNFGAIVINTVVHPDIDTQPNFDLYFSLLYQKAGVRAYRILEVAP